ncbi:hypothetical protein MMC25_008163 [Agyrium rufum]|nr:hypothetical protein [Agyrium rufum]
MLKGLLHFSALVGFVLGHGGTHKPSGAVQFCRNAPGSSGVNGPDFCVSATTWENPSTLMQDMYLSIRVDRQSGTSKGWTAFGPGNMMDGALMFVVYGDPKSGRKPTVSIRTTNGHAPPKLISLEDAGGADFDLMGGSWTKSNQGIYSAMLNVAFTNCTRWPGTSIDVSSTTQPWIWAHNSNQNFPVYTFNAPLEMHGRSAADFGRFYFNMPASIKSGVTWPSFPAILKHQGMIGASLASDSISRGRAWQLHGVLMGLAFLILLPSGVISLRSQSPQAFKLHWMLQLGGYGSMALGTLIALLLHPQIIHVHQAVGVVIFVALGVQGILGWKHHIIFARLGRRTWISTVHVTLGRSTMLLGAGNVISGLLLANVGQVKMVFLGVLMVLEVLGISFYLYVAHRRAVLARIEEDSMDGEKLMNDTVLDSAFVLDDDDVDDMDRKEAFEANNGNN